MTEGTLILVPRKQVGLKAAKGRNNIELVARTTRNVKMLVKWDFMHKRPKKPLQIALNYSSFFDSVMVFYYVALATPTLLICIRLFRKTCLDYRKKECNFFYVTMEQKQTFLGWFLVSIYPSILYCSSLLFSLLLILGDSENGSNSRKRFQRVEILKIAEPCPLIDPSQVVVTQGEILVADPVLTPIGTVDDVMMRDDMCPYGVFACQ